MTEKSPDFLTERSCVAEILWSYRGNMGYNVLIAPAFLKCLNAIYEEKLMYLAKITCALDAKNGGRLLS